MLAPFARSSLTAGTSPLKAAPISGVVPVKSGTSIAMPASAMIVIVSRSSPLTAAFRAFTFNTSTTFGSAPFAISRRTMPAELSLIAARSSADRPRLVTALTSAPRSSSRRTFSASVTDIIKAVNPAPFAAFTDAPLSSSMRIASSDPLTAVCISGVMPPRARRHSDRRPP